MMAEEGGQEEADGVYMEHQYMCSECQQLFGTLEEVLVHQQIHTAQETDGEAGEVFATSGIISQGQHYQCLECGSLLVNAEELLQHQEMHMREAGMEVEQQGDLQKTKVKAADISEQSREMLLFARVLKRQQYFYFVAFQPHTLMYKKINKDKPAQIGA